MANIKFSQFTQKTTLGTVDFLVGYTGADNVQIDPADLLSDYSQGTGAAGQVTFFSATSTVTGDNNLYWDNTNKRLGIGTTTPVAKLEISDSSNPNLRLRNVSANASNSGTIEFREQDLNVGAFVKYNGDANIFQIGTRTGSTDYARINILRDSGNVGIGTSSPAAKLQVSGTLIATGVSQLGSGGSNVYLTSSSAGSVGIGTSSPSKKLEIVSNTTYDGIQISGSSIPTLGIIDTTNNAKFVAYVRDSDATIGMETNHPLTINTNNTERMRINSTGDAGIGTTPHTAGNTWRSFYVGSSAIIMSRQAASGTDAMFGNNFYINSSNVDKRITTGGASRIFMNQDVVRFQRSASDSSDTTISWSESMRIDSAGNVGIGITSPVAKLHVYQNNSDDDTTAGVTIEQDGTGDAALSFLLSGIRRWRLGIDNNDNDKFKISSATNLAVNNKLTIDVDGNVGIGTTSPQENLEIHDATMSTISLSYEGNSGNGSSIDMNLRPASPIAAPLTSQILFADDGAYRQNIHFKTKTSGTASSGLSTRMTIEPDGNVGIGTTSPAQLLHLEKDDNPMVLLTRNGSNRVLLGDTGSNNGGDLLLYDSSGTNTARIRAGSISYFTGGNVGIGTSNPTQTLHVVGRAEITRNAEVLRCNSLDANGSFVTWQNNGSSIGYIGAGYHLWDSPNNIATSFGIRAQSRLDLGIQADVYMTMLSSGNVGIGTTSPNTNAKLHLYSALSATDVALRITSNADSKTLIGLGDTVDQTAGAIKYDNSNSSMAFEVLNNTEAMRINSSGNVGIGTTSPSAKLEVAKGSEGDYLIIGGDNVSNGRALVFTSSTATSNGALHTINAQSGNGVIAFATASTERMRIDNTGNIVLGANGNQYGLVTIRQDGTSNDNGLAVVDPSNLKSARLWSDGTNAYLSSGATGTGTLVLNEGGGNVGIGVVSPASKLEVDGGDIEVDDSASGLILRSPDGTRYRVTVANGGTLSVSAV